MLRSTNYLHQKTRRQDRTIDRIRQMNMFKGMDQSYRNLCLFRITAFFILNIYTKDKTRQNRIRLKMMHWLLVQWNEAIDEDYTINIKIEWEI